MSSTDRCFSARLQARFTAMVLLPVPPLRLPTAMILLVKAPSHIEVSDGPMVVEARLRYG